MPTISDEHADIEQQLAAAAQANREYELCGRRCADLADAQARLAAVPSEVDTADARREQLS